MLLLLNSSYKIPAVIVVKSLNYTLHSCDEVLHRSFADPDGYISIAEFPLWVKGTSRDPQNCFMPVWYSLWWTFSGFHDRTTQQTRSSSVQRLHEFKEIISHIKVYRKSHVTFPAITPLSRKDYTTVLPPKHYFILICIDQLHHRINKYFYNRTKYSFKLFVCLFRGKSQRSLCISATFLLFLIVIIPVTIFLILNLD